MYAAYVLPVNDDLVTFFQIFGFLCEDRLEVKDFRSQAVLVFGLPNAEMDIQIIKLGDDMHAGLDCVERLQYPTPVWRMLDDRPVI